MVPAKHNFVKTGSMDTIPEARAGSPKRPMEIAPHAISKTRVIQKSPAACAAGLFKSTNNT